MLCACSLSSPSSSSSMFWFLFSNFFLLWIWLWTVFLLQILLSFCFFKFGRWLQRERIEWGVWTQLLWDGEKKLKSKSKEKSFWYMFFSLFRFLGGLSSSLSLDDGPSNFYTWYEPFYIISFSCCGGFWVSLSKQHECMSGNRKVRLIQTVTTNLVYLTL